jgi:hypothetical protein
MGASCPHLCAPFPLCLAGLPRQRAEPFPSRARSLSLRHGTPCQLRLPRDPPWTSTRALAHARRDPRPHRPPTHPSSFLSTTHTRTRSLIPFCTASLSLSHAVPSQLDLAGDPCSPCRSPSSPEATPSDPELHPEVRHLFPCSVSLIMLCRRPISASPEFGRGGPPRPRDDRSNWSGLLPHVGP